MGLSSHLPITWSHGHICESLPTSTHMALNLGIFVLYIPLSCISSPCNLLFLNLQSSLFEPGLPVIFTCSTGDRVDGTMKGPLEKRDQFAVLEYMKGGQMVTHPCAPLPRIEFRHLLVVSMCNCSAWCMIARTASKPNICGLRILRPHFQVHANTRKPWEHENFRFTPMLAQAIKRSRCTHTMHMRTCVPVVVCVARKLCPCPSYSGRRDRNNSVHWRSLYKGGGYLVPNTFSPFIRGIA